MTRALTRITMPKPSKKTIEPLLEEWGRNALKRAKIEAAMDREIAPLKEAYERKCAPINSEAKEKLVPIQKRMTELGDEISKQLLAGVSEDGTIALPQVVTDNAIADVTNEPGPREINPEKFFDHTPPAKRDTRFWACVKIQVGKAEKLLGDVINTISKKPATAKVEIKLRG